MFGILKAHRWAGRARVPGAPREVLKVEFTGAFKSIPAHWFARLVSKGSSARSSGAIFRVFAAQPRRLAKEARLRKISPKKSLT